MKNIFKKLIFIFILLTISIASISFANYDNEVVPISMDGDMPVDITSSQDVVPPNQKNYFYECQGNIKEVDNARPGLGTCVLTVRNFLRGQVCSLTADEGSALVLPRFIRLKDIGE